MGRKFGTLGAMRRREDGTEVQVEVTTYRSDTYDPDSRKPEVNYGDTLEGDLSRRDFTVNAMAYSPVRGLRDDFGGREDLRNGVLRCVGDPGERFREDALRILRALRFAARFGLTIEEKTAAALRENRELLRIDWLGILICIPTFIRIYLILICHCGYQPQAIAHKPDSIGL